MSSTDFVQVVNIPQDLCDYTKQVIRKYASHFRKSGKDDEPPLRVLVHGLPGEDVVVPAGESPPFPYMVPRGERFYHGYRFDMELCDEVVHATTSLQRVFGPVDEEADQSFRNVLGYAAGQSCFESVDGGQLARQLSEALLPAALAVFGEENNPEAVRHSRIYSLYVNLLLPGQSIKIHLDVPELRGVDRSTCPNWLLVAAHCSGLFSEYRVRNVTSVFYPQTVQGGALCAFSPELSGQVFPVEEGLAVVLDTDSCFHHSSQARCSSSVPGQGVEVPRLPAKCGVEVEEVDGQMMWRVVEQDTGKTVCTLPEKDVRFSVSCKFHIFGSGSEASEYVDQGASLSAADLVLTMKEDLVRKGKIPAEENCPLYKLGHACYEEYIQPRAPQIEDIEKAWAKYI
eukprot:TRINITY_DN6519_c0_g1_i3.p1 TRINITY_DN6519_c0_g1~~TRINITY_DN6519_c0_g1_i3.p1  ORF type:complete len:399 (+),score=111.23 TRINITY_DN6519_c0_g1_i3:157-1353(+)